jgi:hypothetical protein
MPSWQGIAIDFSNARATIRNEKAAGNIFHRFHAQSVCGGFVFFLGR